MEVGSDLFNIVITVGFLIFVLIILWLMRALFIANKAHHELKRVKDLTFFQVTIPKENINHEERVPTDNFKEKIAVAEQFFGSLSSLYDNKFEKNLYDLQNQISLEIISLDGQLGFYCVTPREIETIVERQIQSYWPKAQTEKVPLPNIFKAKSGAMMGSELKLAKKFVLPIKTYKYLESDPLNALTNALSKMPPNAGAAIQIIVQPITQDWQRSASITARKVQDGKSFYSEKWYLKALTGFFDILTGILHGAKSDAQKTGPDFKQTPNLTPIQEQQLKSIQEKTSTPGLGTTIRVVTTGPTSTEAGMNLKNIVTAFGQFGSPDKNNFKAKSGSDELIRDYILRRISKKKMILNAEELATIYHFPGMSLETPHVSWAKVTEMPPPTNLPQEGTIIGKSVFRGEERLVRMKNDDRRRHIFMIGKTGVGKTTLFSNMFEQDMREGRGGCFIDPLGDAVEDLLGKVPQNRIQDVILFDPSDTEYPIGLNLLEWHTPDQKDFLIQEAIQIFYKLFDPGQTGIVGPQWEHWFRNAALTVMAQPGGGTLIDVPRIFTDDGYRDKLITYVEDPLVKTFWTQQMTKTADFHKSEMYNYFISKFGRFMTNDLMRNIIGQKKSALNIRKLMDEGKIVLINLSKGKIGEVNSSLLGMILVSKIQMAAFSRADIPEENRKDFYLFVDEFQNFTTDSFASILSEARKYRLNLAITNQYIAQLVEKIRDAVVGNVGTMITYRIGAADAEFLVKEFPGLSVNDLANLDKYNTYTKLLIDGTPTKPFSMKGIKSEIVSEPNMREKVRQYSRTTYARNRAEIQAEYLEQMKQMANQPPAGTNEPLKNL